MAEDRNKKVKKQNNISKKKNKENNEKEPLITVDTTETVEQIDDELSNRINQLYGNYSPSEQKTTNYDPKEIEEARKKLIFLLMGVVAIGFLGLVLFLNPFDFSNNYDNKNDKELSEKKDQKEDVSLGHIDLSEDIVIQLNKTISFSINDSMNIDLFPLYANEVLDTNNIPNNIKLHLITRSKAFEDMLKDSGIIEYASSCNPNGIVISKEKFDNVTTKVFGPNGSLEYSDINYTYFNDSIDYMKITLSYLNDEYLIKCNDYIENTTLVKYVYQNLIDAIRTENTIELYQNVLFVNQTGIYKDVYFTTLITNDSFATLDENINKGSIYKYTFTANGEDYYLSKIEKVKETPQ